MSKNQELLRDVLFTIVCCLAVICAIFVVFVRFWPSAESFAETKFRAACAAVNGNAVWNGRHWECLK